MASFEDGLPTDVFYVCNERGCPVYEEEFDLSQPPPAPKVELYDVSSTGPLPGWQLPRPQDCGACAGPSHSATRIPTYRLSPEAERCCAT